MIEPNPNIHPLRRWLFENEMPIHELAARSGTTQGMLSDIINRKKYPSFRTVAKITAATGGALTANDFQQPTQETPPCAE